MEIIKDLFQEKNQRGRPASDPRKMLNAIFYVLDNAIKWRSLPQVFGATSTVHGWLMKWSRNGIFHKIHQRIVTLYLQKNITKNRQWFATDTSSIKAPFAYWSGNNPTDRRKRGIKKALLVDERGMPLAFMTGPAHLHDSHFYIPFLHHIKSFTQSSCAILAADGAYDSKKLVAESTNQNVLFLAAVNKRRNKLKKPYNPSYRWVVERTHSWLNNYRGLKICWSKSKVVFQAFLSFVAADFIFRRELIFG